MEENPTSKNSAERANKNPAGHFCGVADHFLISFRQLTSGKGRAHLDLSYLLTAGVFVQLALLCYVLGLLTRNELLMRMLILIGTAFYIIYYYFISDTPLWDAILASAFIGVANIWVICVIFIERTTFGMTPKMAEVYSFFPTFNPGQFRKIMKHANWIVAEEETQLTKTGVQLDHLFLVVSGNMSLRRDGVIGDIGPGSFVGEISYLIGGTASADTFAPVGTEYVSWNRADLAKQTKKSPALSNALDALLNHDVAKKLSTSRPAATRIAAPINAYQTAEP